jgi:predicted dehydrogenase
MRPDLRVGLLGCGLISQFAHLFALSKAQGVKLTAVCEVAEDLLEQVSRIHGVESRYSNLTQFLAEADIDAVLVATADDQHVAHAIACLRAGKHVLVEKPLSRSSAEGLSLVDVVETTGCQLQVGNMKRFDPGIQFAHQFVQTDMGERLSVSGWYCDTALRPQMQSTLRSAPIHSTRQQSFDPIFKQNRRVYKLFTHGSHLVNTLRYFGGDIVAVEAKLAAKYDNYSWHGVIEFSDGAVGHFELTTAVSMDWLEGYSVHGERGSIEVKSFLPFMLRGSDVRVYEAGRQEYRSPALPDSDPYERQLEAFARAIQNGVKVTPDVYDGIADLSVLEAIQQSVETSHRVEIQPNIKLSSRPSKSNNRKRTQNE